MYFLCDPFIHIYGLFHFYIIAWLLYLFKNILLWTSVYIYNSIIYIKKCVFFLELTFNFKFQILSKVRNLLIILWCLFFCCFLKKTGQKNMSIQFQSKNYLITNWFKLVLFRKHFLMFLNIFLKREIQLLFINEHIFNKWTN